jgi:hypothetical protein
MNMAGKSKIIITNLLVLLILVVALDFLSAFYFDVRSLVGNNPGASKCKDVRASLPNYKGYNWAEKHFQEFNELPTSYVSYTGWRRMPFNGETITIDAKGLRETHQCKNTNDSLPLVVFLGGSAMWGTGVTDEFTIPSYFAQKDNCTYYVLNYGESSYCAFQDYQFLLLKVVEGLRPRVVITYDGVNNSPYHLPGQFAHAREDQINRLLKEKKRSNKHDYYTLGALRDLVRELRRLFHQSNDPVFEEKEFTRERNRQAAIELLESWLLMRDLCMNTGTEFICVLQPNIFVGNPDLEHMKDHLEYYQHRRSGFDFYRDVPGLLEGKKYEVLKDHFIDLTGIFDGKPGLYIDFCHVIPPGNKIIADTLSKYIGSKNYLYGLTKGNMAFHHK